MRRQRLGSMKFLKQLIITVVASCVLAVGALAGEPQKNDQKQPPPPKERRDVPNPPKEPPPPRNDNGNKGSEGKKGGKP